MPIAWCAATMLIIASGLGVPMAGGPGEAGFGYVFEVTGYGQDLRSGLALYSLAAALFGIAFMFLPKLAGWRFNPTLAWLAFMLMAIGGVLMLVAPQALLAMADGRGEGATALAQAWSATWIEAGGRISMSGALVATATFVDGYFRRGKPSYSPTSSS
jgi:hypothetical protein